MRGRFLLFAAVLAPGCDSSTEPSGVVRIEPVTAAALQGRVGTDVMPVPVVRATDETGRPLPGVGVTFDLDRDGGSIARAAATTDSRGMASVGQWTLGTAIGEYTLTARGGRQQVARFRARADAGPVARLYRFSSDYQVAGMGQALSQPPRVRVADAYDNPVAGAVVTFTVNSGEGRIDGNPAVSDLDGIASLAGWTLGPAPGLQRLSARSANAEVSFSAIARDSVPVPSPSGSIAFVSTRDGNPEIYVVGADGTGLARLTVDAADDADPDWSPDGRRIAFARTVGGRSEVYSMNADGSGVRQVSSTGGRARTPAWSPDGRHIAFESSCDGQGCIRVISADGDGPDVIRLGMERGFNSQPAWSPDGRRMAFVSDWGAFDLVYDIFVTSIDASATAQLTRGIWFEPTPPGGQIPIKWSFQPAFSPDGRIAFLTYRPHFGTRSDPPFIDEIDLAVMNGDGTGLSIIAGAGQTARFAEAMPAALSWSRDGNHIAFSLGTCTGPFGESCSHAVAVVPSDGSQAPRVVVPNGHSPAWRP